MYTDTDMDLMHVHLYQQLDHDVFLQDLETVDHKEHLSVTKARFEQIWKEVNTDESLQLLLRFIQQEFPDTKV